MLVGIQNLLRLLFIGIGILLNISMVHSSEIQAIGFLGSEGQVNVDYLQEDNFIGNVDEDGNPVAPSNNQERTVSQENLELLFHTFIYHPNFLKFDFGFGLVFTQSEVQNYEITSANEPIVYPVDKVSDSALDYNLRLSFFEKKDYPFTLYYVTKHPSINAVSADALISESTRYGGNFLWNAPIRITFDALHYDIKGESNLRVLNDTVDSTNLSAYKSFKNDGHVKLSYSHQITQSSSGSTLVPIVSVKNTLDNLTYDSRYNFGNDREYIFTLVGNYRQNRDSFEYDEIVIAPSFDWRHTEKLRSNYHYSFNVNQYAEVKNTVHTADASVSYIEQNGFSTIFDVTGYMSELDGSQSNLLGIKNSTSYKHDFKHAFFSITGLLGINNTRTVTNYTGPGVNAQEKIKMPAFGNRLEFKRTNIVSEPKDFVVIGIDSILYQFDRDYIIRDLGNGRFDIETLGNSILLPGTEVVVTYLVDPGQDNQFQRTLKGLNTSLGFFDYFNVFAGYNESDVDILEGVVADTLVTKRTSVHAGASIDYPLIEDYMLIGVEVRDETTDETTNKSLITTDNTTDLEYVQFSLFNGVSLYLSRRHSLVDYTGNEGTNNDTNRTSYRALLKIQSSNRSNLSLIYDDSTDVGNIKEIQELTETSIRFEWGYRRIMFYLTGSQLKDLRGTRLRERTAFQFNLVRTF
jgi:hypothetical protein